MIGTLCKDAAGWFIVLSRRYIDYDEYDVFSMRDAMQHAGKDYIRAFTIISNQRRAEHIKTYKETL